MTDGINEESSALYDELEKMPTTCADQTDKNYLTSWWQRIESLVAEKCGRSYADEFGARIGSVHPPNKGSYGMIDELGLKNSQLKGPVKAHKQQTDHDFQELQAVNELFLIDQKQDLRRRCGF